MTTEQEEFRSSVRRYLDGRTGGSTPTLKRLSDRDIDREWQGFAELGWLGLSIPEAFGGVGLDFSFQRVLMEEFGRSLLVSPFLSSCVMAPAALCLSSNETFKQEILPGIASGALKATFGFAEADPAFSPNMVRTTAKRRGSGFVLNGIKSAVPFADVSDIVIVTARTHGRSDEESGIAVFGLDAGAAGIRLTTYATHDGGRVSEVKLDDVFVDEGRMLESGEAGYNLALRVIDAGIAALCAESNGCIREALRLMIAYMKLRSQFGSPLASFQALQHRVAAHYMQSVMAEAELRDVQDPLSGHPQALSAAKYFIGSAATRIVADCVQLHGAIGLTNDLAIGHYLKRVIMIDQCLGEPDTHLERYAANIGKRT